MTTPSPKIVVVRWRDAHGESSEVSQDEALTFHTPAIYYSTGVLVISDEKGVTVAQDYGLPRTAEEGTSYRTRTFVPRELIEEEYIVGRLVKRPKKVTPTTEAIANLTKVQAPS